MEKKKKKIKSKKFTILLINWPLDFVRMWFLLLHAIEVEKNIISNYSNYNYDNKLIVS